MPKKTKSKMQQPRYADLRMHNPSVSETSLGRSTGKQLTRGDQSKGSLVSGTQPEFSLERTYIVPMVTSGESMLKAGLSIGSLDQRKKSLLALAPIDDSTAERSRPRDEEEDGPTNYFEPDNEQVASSNDNVTEDDIDIDSKLEGEALEEGD